MKLDIKNWSTGKKVGVFGGGALALILLVVIIKKAHKKAIDKAKGDTGTPPATTPATTPSGQAPAAQTTPQAPPQCNGQQGGTQGAAYPPQEGQPQGEGASAVCLPQCGQPQGGGYAPQQGGTSQQGYCQPMQAPQCQGGGYQTYPSPQGGGYGGAQGNQVNANGMVMTTPSGKPLTSPTSNQPDGGIPIPNGNPAINGGFSDALQIYNGYMNVGGANAVPDANGNMPWISGGQIWNGSDSNANYHAAKQQLQSIGILDGNGNPI